MIIKETEGNMKEMKNDFQNENDIKSENTNSEHSTFDEIVNGTLESLHVKTELKSPDSETSSSKGKNKNKKKIKTCKSVPGIMLADRKVEINKFYKCLFDNVKGNRNLKKRGAVRKVKSKFSDIYPDKYAVSLVLTGKCNVTDSRRNPIRLPRYELATTINRIKGRIEKRHGEIPNSTTFQEWKEIQDNRSEAEKATDEARRKREDMKMAYIVAKLSVRLLKLFQGATVDEKEVKEILKSFLCIPVSPGTMLYVPEFVHAVMLCRGIKDFSRQLRSLADECYQKCYCMFPVPEESDFETVYISAVKKFLPDSLV